MRRHQSRFAATAASKRKARASSSPSFSSSPPVPATLVGSVMTNHSPLVAGTNYPMPQHLSCGHHHQQRRSYSTTPISRRAISGDGNSGRANDLEDTMANNDRDDDAGMDDSFNVLEEMNAFGRDVAALSSSSSAAAQKDGTASPLSGIDSGGGGGKDKRAIMRRVIAAAAGSGSGGFAAAAAGLHEGDASLLLLPPPLPHYLRGTTRKSILVSKPKCEMVVMNPHERYVFMRSFLAGDVLYSPTATTTEGLKTKMTGGDDGAAAADGDLMSNKINSDPNNQNIKSPPREQQRHNTASGCGVESVSAIVAPSPASPSSSSSPRSVYAVAGAPLSTCAAFQAFSAITAARASLAAARDSVVVASPSPSSSTIVDAIVANDNDVHFGGERLTFPSAVLSSSSTSSTTASTFDGSSSVSEAAVTATESDTALIKALLTRNRRLNKKNENHSSSSTARSPSSSLPPPTRKQASGSHVLSIGQRAYFIGKLSKFIDETFVPPTTTTATASALKMNIPSATPPSPHSPPTASSPSAATSKLKKRLASKLGLEEEAAEEAMLSGMTTATINNTAGTAVGISSASETGGAIDGVGAAETSSPSSLPDSHQRVLLHRFNEQLKRLRRIVFHDVMPSLLLDATMRYSWSRVEVEAAVKGPLSEKDGRDVDDKKKKNILVSHLQRVQIELGALLDEISSRVVVPHDSSGSSSLSSPQHAFLSGHWKKALTAARAQIALLTLNASISQSAVNLIDGFGHSNSCGSVPQQSNHQWWTDGGLGNDGNGSAVILDRAVASIMNSIDHAEGILQQFCCSSVSGQEKKAAPSSPPPSSSSSSSIPIIAMSSFALLLRTEVYRHVLRLQSMLASLPNYGVREAILKGMMKRLNEEEAAKGGYNKEAAPKRQEGFLLFRDMVKEMFLVAEGVATGAITSPQSHNGTTANANTTANGGINKDLFHILPRLIPTATDVNQQIQIFNANRDFCGDSEAAIDGENDAAASSMSSSSLSSTNAALLLLDTRDRCEQLLWAIVAMRAEGEEAATGASHPSLFADMKRAVVGELGPKMAAAAKMGVTPQQQHQRRQEGGDTATTAPLPPTLPSSSCSPLSLTSTLYDRTFDKDHHRLDSIVDSISKKKKSDFELGSLREAPELTDALVTAALPSHFTRQYQRRRLAQQQQQQQQGDKTAPSSSTKTTPSSPSPSSRDLAKELAKGYYTDAILYQQQQQHYDDTTSGSSSAPLSHSHRSLSTLLALIATIRSGDVTTLKHLHQDFTALMTASLFEKGGRGGGASSSSSSSSSAFGLTVSCPARFYVDPQLTPEAVATVTYALLHALSTCCVTSTAVSLSSSAGTQHHQYLQAGSSSEASSPSPLATTTRMASNGVVVGTVGGGLKPLDLMQWAKDAYDDYLTWVPATHWRHPLVLTGLLECASAARDCWKSQVLFQQLLLQGRGNSANGNGNGGGVGGGSESGGAVESVGGGGRGSGGSGGGGLGMARLKGSSGKTRRSRAAGDGFGGREKGDASIDVNRGAATSMDPTSFDAQSRNRMFNAQKSSVAFGIKNRRNRSKWNGGKIVTTTITDEHGNVKTVKVKSSASSSSAATYNPFGMRVTGVIAPSLLDSFLASYRDPFHAFSTMQAQFLFNIRPSTETVHALMVRLLLDHCIVREDNTLITVPNMRSVHDQLAQLQQEVEAEEEEAARSTSSNANNKATKMSRDEQFEHLQSLREAIARRAEQRAAEIVANAPHIPLFDTLALQQKALAEMERIEEEASLRLLISAVDSSVKNNNKQNNAADDNNGNGNGSSEGDAAVMIQSLINSRLSEFASSVVTANIGLNGSSGNNKKTKDSFAQKLLLPNSAGSGIVEGSGSSSSSAAAAAAAAVSASLLSMLKVGIANRREYIYGRQGTASDLLFSVFYLLQKGNKGALKASEKSPTTTANDNKKSGGDFEEEEGAHKKEDDLILKPSSRYFLEGPTPDGLTVSLAILQVVKNYVSDVEAILVNEGGGAGVGNGVEAVEDINGSTHHHRHLNMNVINQAFVQSSRLNPSTTTAKDNAFSSSSPAAAHVSDSSHSTSSSPSLADKLFGASSISQRCSQGGEGETAQLLLPTLTLIRCLAEEALSSVLKILLDGYYPLWAIMGGNAAGPHVIPHRLKRRAMVEVEEEALLGRERVAVKASIDAKRDEVNAKKMKLKRQKEEENGKAGASSVTAHHSSPSPSSPSSFSFCTAVPSLETVQSQFPHLLSVEAAIDADGEGNETKKKGPSSGLAAPVSASILPPLHPMGMTLTKSLLEHYTTLLIDGGEEREVKEKLLLPLGESTSAAASASASSSAPLSEAMTDGTVDKAIAAATAAVVADTPLFEGDVVKDSYLCKPSCTQTPSPPSCSPSSPLPPLSPTADVLSWVLAAMSMPKEDFLKEMTAAAASENEDDTEGQGGKKKRGNATDKNKKKAAAGVSSASNVLAKLIVNAHQKKTTMKNGEGGGENPSCSHYLHSLQRQPAAHMLTEAFIRRHLLPSSSFGSSSVNVSDGDNSAAPAPIVPRAIASTVTSILGSYYSATGGSVGGSGHSFSSPSSIPPTTSTGPSEDTYLFGNQHWAGSANATAAHSDAFNIVSVSE